MAKDLVAPVKLKDSALRVGHDLSSAGHRWIARKIQQVLTQQRRYEVLVY